MTDLISFQKFVTITNSECTIYTIFRIHYKIPSVQIVLCQEVNKINEHHMDLYESGYTVDNKYEIMSAFIHGMLSLCTTVCTINKQ